jgi:transcriptional regulator with XRE-family HTH domain
MGLSPRYVPKYLGTKLAKVREKLGIETYEEMIARLDVKEVKLHRASIMRFEKGKLEPPSIVLLKYAKLAGITIDDLVDDTRELPK